VTIADRTWDNLPPEIHSRIMAATAHAQTRVIEASDASRQWEVNALAGDRLVHMTLGLRDDGSVSEETRTFLTSEVMTVSLASDEGAPATLEVHGSSGAELMQVPDSIGRALSHRDEEGLERAVKGIGQGIAGRLKELTGELLDNPEMERAGIVQQLDSKIRRADDDDKPSS
jgi:uncharacterized protein YjbJ (UPF0337 family)